jgi:hypothetical protein
LQWLKEQDRATQLEFEGADFYKDVALELKGNLYGRGPAGATFRDEFADVVVNKLKATGYEFVHGGRDSCVYTCKRTDATVLHHLDDARATVEDKDLDFLQSKA